MQPLFSAEYTKPLVTIQALFLKHVVYEYMRGWKIHPTHPLSILMHTHTPTPTPCKNFRVSSLRYTWKQLLECSGPLNTEYLVMRVLSFISFSSDHMGCNLHSKTKQSRNSLQDTRQNFLLSLTYPLCLGL